MSKKQTLSKTELQEMTGLDFSEQNSQVEESRKKSIDAALEDFSIENIARQHLDTYDADFEQWRKL